MRRLALALFIVTATLCASGARAEDIQYDQVEFSVHAETALQNDLAEVVLAVEVEHPDPAQLASEINRTMSWALSQARGTNGVDSQTGDYQTYPIYEKDRLLRWRGTQTLTLRSSQKIESLNKLVGMLQQRLQVKSMQFTVSPERQRANEAQLTDQLMDHFKERASRIQRGLAAKGYRIVRLNLDGATPPPHFPVISRMSVMEKSSDAAATEAGSSKLRLDLRAVIQLQF